MSSNKLNPKPQKEISGSKNERNHDWGFSVLFPQFKANAGVKPAKKGHGPHSSIFVLFYVFFVLCRSVYCLCVNVRYATATRWLPNCS